MKVHSSHLALRFYENDGGTYDILKECLIRGDIESSGDIDYPYFRLKHPNSNFDYDKLMRHVTEVVRYSKNAAPLKTDREYIESI